MLLSFLETVVIDVSDVHYDSQLFSFADDTKLGGATYSLKGE